MPIYNEAKINEALKLSGGEITPEIEAMQAENEAQDDISMELVITNKTVVSITDNLEELKKQAVEITSKYKDVVIIEKDLPIIKKEMANLNKVSKEINSRRIAIGKELKKPADQLKTKADEVINIFTTTYNYLGEQVSVFEEDKKLKKQAVISEKIKNICAGYKLEASEIEFDERWLNKTFTNSKIDTALNELAKSIVDDKAQNAEIEKLRLERVEAIEKINISEASKHDFTLSVYDIINSENSVVDALTEITKRYNDEKSKRDLATEIAKQAIVSEKPKLKPAGAKKDIELIACNIKFRFEKPDEEAVNKLLLELRGYCSKGFIREVL